MQKYPMVSALCIGRHQPTCSMDIISNGHQKSQECIDIDGQIDRQIDNLMLQTKKKLYKEFPITVLAHITYRMLLSPFNMTKGCSQHDHLYECPQLREDLCCWVRVCAAAPHTHTHTTPAAGASSSPSPLLASVPAACLQRQDGPDRLGFSRLGSSWLAHRHNDLHSSGEGPRPLRL